MWLLVFASLAAATPAVKEGPCDIFEQGGTPCVAAHSTVRALFASYNGPLYEVLDHEMTSRMIMAVEGFADSASQDGFCGSQNEQGCIISQIFDQSGKQNHLGTAPGGGAHGAADNGANATALKLKIGGRTVYGALFEHGSGPGRAHSGTGYRCDNTTGVAKGDEPQTIYMVTAGRRYNAGCCFDYGNAETDNHDHGAGTMEAVYWGNLSLPNRWSKGTGSGPWVMADLESGLWAGSQSPMTTTNTPIHADYVTAMVKGDSGNHFALKGGDAQVGKLKTMYDGVRPKGYEVMKKQGAIVLGVGGDNSDAAMGAFFEGVMTAGYTTDATDDAVQANIVAAGYGKSLASEDQVWDENGWPVGGPAAPTAGTQTLSPIRVTCVGDSITIHACASNNSMPYPQQLGRMLGPGYTVLNAGNSGKNMLKKGLCGGGGNCCGPSREHPLGPDGKCLPPQSTKPCPQCGGDCAYWDQSTYKLAMDSNPDIVTIMLGTNDAKGCNWDYSPDGVQGKGDLFRKDGADMIAKFKALPSKPKVFVVHPPPLFPPWPFNMSAHAINVEFMTLQKKMAEESGADGFIDIWTPLKNINGLNATLGGQLQGEPLTCDGCHPKDAGLTIMATEIMKAIKAAGM
jgi:lysophospholipase L1-like esterase